MEIANALNNKRFWWYDIWWKKFKFLPQDFQIKGKLPNWDSINAFSEGSLMLLTKNVKESCQITKFYPAFLHSLRIYTSDLRYLSDGNT